MPLSGKTSRARRALLLLSAALAALASISVAAADFGVPKPITEEGERIEDLWIFTLAAAAVVFVLVEGALLYTIFKFRRRGDELPAQTHGSNVLEVIWTTIPVLIVIGLFSFSFVVLRDVENEAPEDAMTINVTGFQFQWQFDYPLNDLGPGSDPAATGAISVLGKANEEPTLVMPVGEPVEFTLTSNDVIHSFYVRDFLYKLDVVPGRDNRFVVTANEEGEFFGQCAELCGLNHAIMRFKVKVVSRAEFDTWVSEQSAGSAAVRQP